MHQLIAEMAVCAIYGIGKMGIQALQLHAVVWAVDFVEYLIPAYQCGSFVGADCHPGGKIAVKGRQKAVEIAELEDLTVFFHEGNLVADLLSFFSGQLV